jgi:hypothetical protein
MTSIREIKQAYEDCLNRAVIWLNRNGYSVNPTTVVARKNGTGEVVVEIVDMLHFRDWPYRDGSPEKIDILARLVETISLGDGACTKSTLRVNYFRIDCARAIATESLHYDFGLPPQTKHPICHVQNSNDVLNNRPESFRRDIDNMAIRDRCQNVRIPCAFMNLPGLFAVLAADHMSEKDWREFMGECGKYFEKVPVVAAHDVIDVSIAGGRLSAWKWYWS